MVSVVRPSTCTSSITSTGAPWACHVVVVSTRPPLSWTCSLSPYLFAVPSAPNCPAESTTAALSFPSNEFWSNARILLRSPSSTPTVLRLNVHAVTDAAESLSICSAASSAPPPYSNVTWSNVPSPREYTRTDGHAPGFLSGPHAVNLTGACAVPARFPTAGEETTTTSSAAL